MKLEDTRDAMRCAPRSEHGCIKQTRIAGAKHQQTPRSSCRMATTRSRDFSIQVVQYVIPLSNAPLVFSRDMMLFIFLLVGYITLTPSIHLVIRSSSLLLHVSLVATELSISARPILSFRRRTHRDQK